MLGTLSVSWDTFFARDAINVYQASFRLVSLLHAKRACNVYRLSLSLFLHGFLQGFSVTGTAQIRKASCDEQSWRATAHLLRTRLSPVQMIMPPDANS